MGRAVSRDNLRLLVSRPKPRARYTRMDLCVAFIGGVLAGVVTMVLMRPRPALP